MSKKLSYLKYRLLSKITTGKKRQYYKQKKKEYKQRLLYKKYGPLEAAIQKLEDYQAYHKFYLMFKQRFNIDIPADACGAGNFFELIRIPLKDLRRKFPDGSIRPLTETPHYQYLKTNDISFYQNHLQYAKMKGIMSENSQTWSVKRFQELIEKIKKEGYQPEKSAIVIDQENIIYDGVHRSSILLYLYGGDYEIPVVQISRR